MNLMNDVYVRTGMNGAVMPVDLTKCRQRIIRGKVEMQCPRNPSFLIQEHGFCTLHGNRLNRLGLKQTESNKNVEKLMKEFLDLDTRLSPEWLTCDGELNRSQVQARYNGIMREWKALEIKFGRLVSREEVEKWANAHYAKVGLQVEADL